MGHSIANIQHNRFCKGNQIIVLGQVNVCEEMKEVEHLDFHDIDDRSKLSQLVEKLTKTFLILFLILSNLVKPNNNMVVTTFLR
jgi:formiminoglutamase